MDRVPVYTDRLFFAIFPDPDAARRIAALALQQRFEHGLRGRPLEISRLHTTLHHIGDYEGSPAQDVLDKAYTAATSIALTPFEVAFDRVMSFGRKARANPFVLRGDKSVAALMALQKALGAAMDKAALPRQVERSYTPHVTLLYDDRSVPVQAVETIQWKVHEFVLVHSLLGQTVHRHIGRWPLLAVPTAKAGA